MNLDELRHMFRDEPSRDQTSSADRVTTRNFGMAPSTKNALMWTFKASYVNDVIELWEKGIIKLPPGTSPPSFYSSSADLHLGIDYATDDSTSVTTRTCKCSPDGTYGICLCPEVPPGE